MVARGRACQARRHRVFSKDMADNDIYANPPDPEALELESVHPGIGDAAYENQVLDRRCGPRGTQQSARS